MRKPRRENDECFPYRSVAFIDDILRGEFWESKEFVYGLIKESIKQGTGLSIIESPRVAQRDWTSLGFDKDSFLKIIKDSNKTWMDCYSSIPDQASSIMLQALRNDTVYVGYEMPNWLKNLLDENNFQYIDIRLSPIRFARDLCFAINSNCQTIRKRLSAFEIPKEFFRIEASQIKASIFHLRGRPTTYEYENALIFVGQTNTDSSLLMSGTGELLRPTHFSEKLKSIRAKYETIHYLPHPYSGGRAVEELAELEILFQEKVGLCNMPSYELLCEESRTGFVAISSGFLQEAKCFDREVFFLYRPICPLEDSGRYYNVELDDISDPFFWSSMMPMDGLEVASLKNVRKSAPNQLRLLHNAWWGYNDLMLRDRTHYKDIVRFGGATTAQDLNQLRDEIHHEVRSIHSRAGETAELLESLLDGYNSLKETAHHSDLKLRSVLDDYHITKTLANERAQTITELQNSTSWRITRPLRNLKSWLIWIRQRMAGRR